MTEQELQDLKALHEYIKDIYDDFALYLDEQNGDGLSEDYQECDQLERYKLLIEKIAVEKGLSL